MLAVRELEQCEEQQIRCNSVVDFQCFSSLWLWLHHCGHQKSLFSQLTANPTRYTQLLVRHPEHLYKNIRSWRKTCCHVGGTHLFKVINEVHIFFKILVFVVFGNSFSDKHSLLWCLALPPPEIILQLYCHALMSLSCQQLQNPKLTGFYCSTVKRLQLMENISFYLQLRANMSIESGMCGHYLQTQYTYLLWNLFHYMTTLHAQWPIMVSEVNRHTYS